MRTQCCQPVHGSVRCNDCPFTMPLYRQPVVPMGWICPKCGGSNAPNITHCVLCPQPIPEVT